MENELYINAIKKASSLLKKELLPIKGTKEEKNEEINQARSLVARDLNRKSEKVFSFLFEGGSSTPDKTQIGIEILREFIDSVCTKHEKKTYCDLKAQAMNFIAAKHNEKKKKK